MKELKDNIASNVAWANDIKKLLNKIDKNANRVKTSNFLFYYLLDSILRIQKLLYKDCIE